MVSYKQFTYSKSAAYLEPSRTPTMGIFRESLLFLQKNSIVNVWLGSKYTSVSGLFIRQSAKNRVGKGRVKGSLEIKCPFVAKKPSAKLGAKYKKLIIATSLKVKDKGFQTSIHMLTFAKLVTTDQLGQYFSSNVQFLFHCIMFS